MTSIVSFQEIVMQQDHYQENIALVEGCSLLLDQKKELLIDRRLLLLERERLLLQRRNLLLTLQECRLTFEHCVRWGARFGELE
jgi:hypothetical protein